MNTDYPSGELPTGSAFHGNFFQDLDALRSVNLHICEYVQSSRLRGVLTTLLASSVGTGREPLRILSANNVTSGLSPMNIDASVHWQYPMRPIEATFQCKDNWVRW